MEPKALERFHESYIPVPESGCWLWLKSTFGNNSYGAFSMDGKLQGAHRVAYEAFVGQIPPGFIVMHKCDTPICVRPSHLRLGSQRENIHEAISKGRMPHLKSKHMTQQKIAKILETAKLPAKHGMWSNFCIKEGLTKDAVFHWRKKLKLPIRRYRGG